MALFWDYEAQNYGLIYMLITRVIKHIKLRSNVYYYHQIDRYFVVIYIVVWGQLRFKKDFECIQFTEFQNFPMIQLSG